MFVPDVVDGVAVVEPKSPPVPVAPVVFVFVVLLVPGLLNSTGRVGWACKGFAFGVDVEPRNEGPVGGWLNNPPPDVPAVFVLVLPMFPKMDIAVNYSRGYFPISEIRGIRTGSESGFIAQFLKEFT